MAARGRTAGFQMGAEHRSKIAKSMILKHLVEHVEGKRDMTSTQVTAGIALMKKVMPDLAAVDHTTDGEKIAMPTEIILKAASADSND